MRKVKVAGVGMIPFGKYAQSTTADLAVPAALQALQDAGIRREQVNAAYCGSAYGGMMTGQRLFAKLGIGGIPIMNVENACSSSSTAFHQAYFAIASGQYDVALVVGVDRLSQFGGGAIPLARDDWEVSLGLVMPALYAMRARRYMYEHGISAADLGEVAVKARRHGVLNPDAQFRKAVTLDEVINARPIAEPFTLLHCCPTGDGAAAAVLCAEDVSLTADRPPVRILASKLSSGVYTGGYRDMTTAEITVQCARAAYEIAGLGPEEIDVAEIHDAFTIAELMYYEALGFCAQGEAVRLLRSGVTSLGGRVPVNPSGGLLAKGHPVGATGLAQIVEVVRQLRGDCGARQVEGARVGMTHATGGGVTGLDHGACAIHILGR